MALEHASHCGRVVLLEPQRNSLMLRPTIKTTLVTDGSVAAAKNMRQLVKTRVLVGVPQESLGNSRGDKLLTRASKFKTRGKKFRKIMQASESEISNAELTYIHTHGSMAQGIPPRPIIEPAIEANTSSILPELREAGVAQLDGNRQASISKFKRVALIAQNVVRGWFTDPRNHWAPNAPSTIRRKGSDRPLIHTGELRKAMVGIVAEDN